MPVPAPTHALRAALTAAIDRAIGLAGVDPLLAPTRQPDVDLQANFAMKLAKRSGQRPREIAEQVAVAVGDVDGMLAAVEVSGPGFLNLSFSPRPLAAWATAALNDPRLGVPVATGPQTVVVDYSAPNVAKQMHVGHLRSTVIGDALVRALEFAGHTVLLVEQVRAVDLDRLARHAGRLGLDEQRAVDAALELVLAL